MSSKEKFCLRWNDFEKNISGAFQEIRSDNDFFDVTLACEGDQVVAHKVILAACSPFFREVLRRNPHHHPLLYLRGIRHTEMVAVLDFMYRGEVSVAQEELNTFLSVAEDLQIKGLTQNKNEGSQLDHTTRRNQTHSQHQSSESHRKATSQYRQHHQKIEEAESDIQEIVPVKTEAPGDVIMYEEEQEDGGAEYEEGYEYREPDTSLMAPGGDESRGESLSMKQK